MALLNNFSVLPWYEHTAEQDFRRWWKYGRKYPLYGDTLNTIPSQIFRSQKRTGYNIATLVQWDSLNDNEYIAPGGIGIISSPGVQTRLAYYPIGGGLIRDDDIIIVNYTERFQSYSAWGIIDSGSNVLYYNDQPGEIDLADYYPNAAYLVVQVNDPSRTNRVWIADNGSGVLLPRMTVLRTPDGDFVKDVLSADMWAGATRTEGDYLICDGGYIDEIPIGQYYLEASDGISTWVSDIFTIVPEMDDYLEIEWGDADDFVMDAGRIVYKNPTFKNRLYLRADLAKPEYEFEEEGETRDGVFYPTKQISKKKYNFHFFAPEYLLDVMRLIRMADEVRITYLVGRKTLILYPTTFLLTPEWEREGDLAGVSAEFETDTVAKKVGLAYIREA